MRLHYLDMKLAKGVQIGALVLLLCSPAGRGAETTGSDAAATLVVFNENDRGSDELARFYAGKRGIPGGQILGLKCPTTEEISRAEYDETIAEPLRRAFTANFWWKLREPDSPLGPVESNKIRFVALIRGMPLKISEAKGRSNDQPAGVTALASVNQASVDSELAALGCFSRDISGAMNSPYYRRFMRIADLRRPEIMLVCRLDAPTPAIVRRMITDAITVERDGLRGFAYIDARGLARGNNYEEGDQWLLAAAKDVRRSGLPVIMDNGPDLFPAAYPMRNAALYYGWYSAQVSGPFRRDDFRFNPGAVAVHIHSFSAASLRDPEKYWVAPLLAAGAAASFGSVYEPFLTLTPHLDIFESRLRAGYTFAESGYMSQRVLSWMTTFVGDPLYRPFRDALELKDGKGDQWTAYREGTERWFSKDRAAGEAYLRAAGAKLRSGVIMEGLGLLQLSAEDRTAALQSFAQARRYYGGAEDAVRVALHEIVQLRAAKREPEAAALARETIAAFSPLPAVEVLRIFAGAGAKR